MERLANAIRIAAKLREESFDHKLANDEENNQLFDFNKCYKLTLREACDKAAEGCGFTNKEAFPIYLLLMSNWNESLDWANTIES
jgi:hypothetical protein